MIDQCEIIINVSFVTFGSRRIDDTDKLVSGFLILTRATRRTTR